MWSPPLAGSARRATILPERHTLTERADATLPVRDPGRFLIDPDGAVTRAGLVKELGTLVGECWQIDDQVAFLSVDRLVETPFGRTLEVAASEPWGLRRLIEALRDLDVGAVDIRKRGSAVDVDDLQRDGCSHSGEGQAVDVRVLCSESGCRVEKPASTLT